MSSIPLQYELVTATEAFANLDEIESAYQVRELFSNAVDADSRYAWESGLPPFFFFERYGESSTVVEYRGQQKRLRQYLISLQRRRKISGAMYRELAETFVSFPESAASKLVFYGTGGGVGLHPDYHLEIPTVEAAWSLSIVQLLEYELLQKIGNCKLPECRHIILDVPRRSRQSRQYCCDQHANTYRARKKRGTL